MQQRHPNVTFLLAGVPAGQYDLMSEVNRKFPIWVGLTFGMIFLVIAVSFRSLVIPLRLLLTVGYTLAWSYGAAVLVFQSGLFDFIPALRGIDGLCWDVPVVAFFMVSALALDYDVFLLTSVVEHRRRGYTDRAAVVKSVHATGKIISYAGVIMAVALASLLFSSVANLAMLGVQILVAVLLDTFLVRPVFVPALMAVAEHWTWWPSRPPPGELTEDDFDEDWSGLARE